MASYAQFDLWQTTSGANVNTIVQVVQTYYADPTSQSFPATTGNGLMTAIAGLSATISPKSTASRILVMCRWFGEHGSYSESWNSMYGLKRNGVDVGQPSNPGALTCGIAPSALTYYGADNDSTGDSASFQYVDSPATTSAVTYQMSYCAYDGETLYTNRDVNAATSGGYERGTSSIILMEIAG